MSFLLRLCFNKVVVLFLLPGLNSNSLVVHIIFHSFSSRFDAVFFIVLIRFAIVWKRDWSSAFHFSPGSKYLIVLVIQTICNLVETWAIVFVRFPERNWGEVRNRMCKYYTNCFLIFWSCVSLLTIIALFFLDQIIISFKI